MTVVAFPPVERPLVSIVVVTYGGFDLVVPALQAVAQHTVPPYEVIVVDNASPDGTGARLLDTVSGATIVLNEVNIGFGAAANQGALLAVGRHLFFLNSDAFVQPGWLPPLLAVVDEDPTVAAVASCLIDPDGTLQEAGGIVGAHGYAGQLGMGADAARPEYRFRRDVDYASAAALLVRRRDFLDIGGFHPGYVLGYFEDVDLCLELGRRGLRTVFQPASLVSHVRGGSTDPDEALRRATASHELFARRWSQDLDRRPVIAELDVLPHRLVAARDFVAAPRVLILSVEAPDTTLSRLVIAMARLWTGARITLVVADAPLTGAALEDLLDAGVEVAVGEADWERWLLARRFHCSVVALDGADAVRRFNPALERSQPHAARIQLARFGSGPVDLELDAVSNADLVVCLSDRARDLVATWVARTRGPVLGCSPPANELVDALAGLGVAPPLIPLARA